MIEIIPAISVVGHKLARTNHGDLHDVVFYDGNPLDVAMELEDHGIKRINLIDIEGSQRGAISNLEVLEMIKGYTELSIDFGGGINSDDDVRLAFEHGASTIHAASIAVKDRETFSSWIISYGRNKIILSVDSYQGKLLTKGWGKDTDIDLMELIEYYHDHGILYVKCTDVVKDGQLEGPSYELYNKILNKFPDLRLIASGGVQSIHDIEKLQDLGVYGVIFAKALYQGQIRLKELERFLI